MSGNDLQVDKIRRATIAMEEKTKRNIYTSNLVDTFFTTSTCSGVLGVIDRTWSLDQKGKQDISKRLE